MTELDKCINIFKRIEATGGKNDKISIIKENGDNELFVSMLQFLYSDQIRTGLALTKINKEVKESPEKLFDDISEVMEYIQENNTGTDSIIATMQAYLSQFNGEELQFMKEFFTKTYKCGITVKSVNKALGDGTVFEFSCQLAQPYEKYADKLPSSFTITEKLDGHRTIAIMEDGKLSILTRKGHPINELVEIEESIHLLSEVTGLTSFVLDGEIIVTETDGVDRKDIFKVTGKILRSKGVKRGLTFHVFDMLKVNEFKGLETSESYAIRCQNRQNLFSQLNSKHVVNVPVLYQGGDTDEIIRWSSFAGSEGWEGIMLNDDNSPYERKRTSALLKVKSFYSSDVQVIDVYEGKQGTKNEGSLGGVVIQFKDFTVNVGSGFDDSERKEFWEDPSKIVGKIIDVQYFEETTNDKGGKSLRFPTYKGIRYDKDVDDISYES